MYDLIGLKLKIYELIAFYNNSLSVVYYIMV